MTTRTQKLITICNALYAVNKTEIDALATNGPRGGCNAAYIDGWAHNGIAVITRAANLSDLPTMPYWSGSAPTPATSIPRCVNDLLIGAHTKLFAS